MTRGSILAAILSAALVGCGGLPGSQPVGTKAEATPAVEEYTIDDARINESSGLARSQRDPQRLWTHNDSGGATELYAIDGQGHFQGTLRVRGVLNLDWEDMTSFVEDGEPRLLIADVGDNDAIRPFITLYVVAEPETAGLALPFDVAALPLRQIQVLYPDGARDVEGVAVDAQEGSIYLVSKRESQPKLYRVPLAPVVPVVVAENLGPINIPRAPVGAPNPESINWVTSLDIDDEATTLAALTLTRAYLYARGPGESWAATLQRAPRELDLPDYPQIEACALAPESDALLITSEGSPAPFARIPLPMPDETR